MLRYDPIAIQVQATKILSTTTTIALVSIRVADEFSTSDGATSLLLFHELILLVTPPTVPAIAALMTMMRVNWMAILQFLESVMVWVSVKL